MKILFVGETVPGSRALQRLEALRGLGHQVHLVPTTPEGGNCERKPSLLYRALYRLRLPPDLAGTNAALTALDARAFDLALFDNARTVRRRTLEALKARHPGLPLVWFCEDDMMNPRHRTRWVAGAIALFDLWVTTKSYNAEPEELPSLGARRILFVDNAYDPALHRPLEVSAGERDRFGADISFIGTCEAPRAASLLHLARSGLRCRVWGNGWAAWAGAQSNLVIENRPVYNLDYARVLCSSKINLCFLRHFNRDRQTTRSIEIPACGAFMLHERSAEMTGLLRADHEAAYFGSDDELVSQCRRWLADDAGRAAIAAAGLERVRSLGLSHAQVLGRILDTALDHP